MELGTVEVVAKIVGAPRAAEAAAATRNGETESDIGGPTVGPGFEDVERDGGGEFGDDSDSVVDLEPYVFNGAAS